MKIHDKHYVIISAHQKGNSLEENAKAQSSLLYDILGSLVYQPVVVPVTGRYKGVEEEAFAVLMPSLDEVGADEKFDALQDLLVDLAGKYNQETILLIFGGSSEGALYPIKNMKLFPEYDICPWIELKDELLGDITVDYTIVQGRTYILDTDNGVDANQNAEDALNEIISLLQEDFGTAAELEDILEELDNQVHADGEY